jgi:hypothetical protein
MLDTGATRRRMPNEIKLNGKETESKQARIAEGSEWKGTGSDEWNRDKERPMHDKQRKVSNELT